MSEVRSSGATLARAGRSDLDFVRAMTSEWRFSRLICFSSAQITQNMNASAGPIGMRSKMKLESTMAVTSNAASERREERLHCAPGNGILSFLMGDRRP